MLFMLYNVLQSKAGITPADLEPLTLALNEARSDGMTDDEPFMVKAVVLEDR